MRRGGQDRGVGERESGQEERTSDGRERRVGEWPEGNEARMHACMQGAWRPHLDHLLCLLLLDRHPRVPDLHLLLVSLPPAAVAAAARARATETRARMGWKEESQRVPVYPTTAPTPCTSTFHATHTSQSLLSPFLPLCHAMPCCMHACMHAAAITHSLNIISRPEGCLEDEEEGSPP
jgi:hypothetical protein